MFPSLISDITTVDTDRSPIWGVDSKNILTSSSVSRSTTPMSTENPQHQTNEDQHKQQEPHQQQHPDTILSYSEGSPPTTTLSAPSGLDHLSTELVDEKVQLNQGSMSKCTNFGDAGNTKTIGVKITLEVDTATTTKNHKDATITDPTTGNFEQSSPATSSSVTLTSLETMEPFRAHCHGQNESHLHLHRHRHTSCFPSDSDFEQDAIPQSHTPDPLILASTSPSPPSTTPASPTFSLNRRLHPQEITLEDTRTTWYPLSPPSGTLYKTASFPTQQHASHSNPLSPKYRSHIFSSYTSSLASSSPSPLPPQLVSGARYIPSFSPPPFKESSDTRMGYSPSSDTTSQSKDKEEQHQLVSDPKLADLEPSDQRQTKSVIDKYAAAEHSADRGEHSQLYSHSRPRGSLETPGHLHNTTTRPPTAHWSASTSGSFSFPSLAPKPHTMTPEESLETSTRADNKQHQPPLHKNSTAAARIVNESIANPLNTAGETEGTGTGATHPFKVLSARGTPKGPLPIDVQISLLSSVLKHDPFNCPIRKTTQVWEQISKEQGIRARTCARRYDNIIQANIAGRDRPTGTEEQIATKKKLLEQLLLMMNQPQAIVRMQKKRRYRSEEADKKLLLETIRLNPFAQKVGQVAKAWEDVRDALGMKVHARQCIRRVNRMIKPYLLRERMYNGNIPEELREDNDDLVKQVIQLMYLGGHSGSLEDDDGQSNDDESVSGISDPDDQDDGLVGSEARKRELPQEDELEDDEDENMAGLSETEQYNSNQKKPSSFFGAGALQYPSTSESSRKTRTSMDRTVFPEYNQSHSSGYGCVDMKKREKDAGMSEGARSTRLESEFRPQRIWTSYPYSKEALTRSASGSYRPKSRSSWTSSAVDVREYQYDTGYDRQQDETMSHSGDLNYRSTHPSTSDIARRSMPLSPRSAPASSSTQSLLAIDPSTQLYHTVLHEFHVVKDYLGRLEDQRQRDKDNQKAMYSVIERLQHQVQEQQRYIEDLQNQVQNRSSPQPHHESGASALHSQRPNRHSDSSTHHHYHYYHHKGRSGPEFSRSPST